MSENDTPQKQFGQHDGSVVDATASDAKRDNVSVNLARDEVRINDKESISLFEIFVNKAIVKYILPGAALVIFGYAVGQIFQFRAELSKMQGILEANIFDKHLEYKGDLEKIKNCINDDSVVDKKDCL